MYFHCFFFHLHAPEFFQQQLRLDSLRQYLIENSFQFSTSVSKNCIVNVARDPGSPSKQKNWLTHNKLTYVIFLKICKTIFLTPFNYLSTNTCKCLSEIIYKHKNTSKITTSHALKKYFSQRKLK